MKKQFPDEFIQQVKAANDIVEVASEYFQTVKMGSIHQAACIHGDKQTNSLTFFPDTQTFYCFGCGAGAKNEKTEGSDVINFMMWIEKCTFKEALVQLAEKKSIPVPQKEMTAEEKKRAIMISSCMQANREHWTTLQQRPDLLEYLEKRGIGQEEVDKWRIGYDHNKRRIVFPIINDWGQTVAFSYRNMEEHFPNPDNPDTLSKYINSPKSSIFDKGSILYGLHNIKRLIRHKDYIVIAEGFGDTILGQKHGQPFASIMGTSLTSEHIALISRYTKNVILWLDGDRGGMDATLRYIRPLREAEMLVKVLMTPGQDPDDVIMQKKDNVYEVIEQAVMAGQFQVDQILSQHGSKLAELKLDTARKLKPILESITDPVEKEIYAGQIGDAIGVDKKTLLEVR